MTYGGYRSHLIVQVNLEIFPLPQALQVLFCLNDLRVFTFIWQFGTVEFGDRYPYLIHLIGEQSGIYFSALNDDAFKPIVPAALTDTSSDVILRYPKRKAHEHFEHTIPKIALVHEHLKQCVRVAFDRIAGRER